MGVGFVALAGGGDALGACVQLTTGSQSVESLQRAVAAIQSTAEAPCGTDQVSKTYGNLEVTYKPDCSIDIDQTFDAQAAIGYRNRSFTFQEDGRLTWFTGTNDYERLSQTTGMGSPIAIAACGT
jgi:hypothetical protein